MLRGEEVGGASRPALRPLYTSFYYFFLQRFPETLLQISFGWVQRANTPSRSNKNQWGWNGPRCAAAAAAGWTEREASPASPLADKTALSWMPIRGVTLDRWLWRPSIRSEAEGSSIQVSEEQNLSIDPWQSRHFWFLIIACTSIKLRIWCCEWASREWAGMWIII